MTMTSAILLLLVMISVQIFLNGIEHYLKHGGP